MDHQNPRLLVLVAICFLIGNIDARIGDPSKSISSKSSMLNNRFLQTGNDARQDGWGIQTIVPTEDTNSFGMQQTVPPANDNDSETRRIQPPATDASLVGSQTPVPGETSTTTFGRLPSVAPADTSSTTRLSDGGVGLEAPAHGVLFGKQTAPPNQATEAVPFGTQSVVNSTTPSSESGDDLRAPANGIVFGGQTAPPTQTNTGVDSDSRKDTNAGADQVSDIQRSPANGLAFGHQTAPPQDASTETPFGEQGFVDQSEPSFSQNGRVQKSPAIGAAFGSLTSPPTSAGSSLPSFGSQEKLEVTSTSVDPANTRNTGTLGLQPEVPVSNQLGADFGSDTPAPTDGDFGTQQEINIGIPSNVNAAPPRPVSNASSRQADEAATDGSTENVRRHVLANTCDMMITFFQGKGHIPTADEVDALLFETKRFFTDLYSSDFATRNVFVGFAIKNVRTSNALQSADTFELKFDTAHAFTADSSVSISAIDRILDDADFEDFIKNYVWQSPPSTRNVFYETHEVQIECHHLEGSN